ncbi:hypothetical protein B0T26DRAFT_472630 [Lasiosphaeria miniovina]|uniref:Uncharacterized protein n=1 Tax=Lasiosphaeria miniovina TaxID=1954250 RepID=A0AA40A062_9PEZI|nr:uncharacterized protein B0T26DRAFT_472630 [Lasiosphaeria miniovina]KAK0706785.1 hypothetical protein B0T26DRAFT_472630 [Lasiosphaeria miniovina]
MQADAGPPGSSSCTYTIATGFVTSLAPSSQIRVPSQTPKVGQQKQGDAPSLELQSTHLYNQSRKLPGDTWQTSPAMELYAAGFNAWNQLRFPPQSHAGQQEKEKEEVDDEPDDLSSFTCVLRDKDGIDDVEPFLSYTLGE